MIADILVAFMLFLCLFALASIISLLYDILTVCRRIQHYIERNLNK